MNWGDVFAVRRLRVQVGWLLVFVCLFLLSSRGWCAQAQTFVTEDGQVIVGEVVMEGENAIAVRTARGTVSLSKSELLDVSPEEAIAYGLIWDGRKARAKGEEAQTADDLGAAVYYYRLAVDRLDAVSSDATEQFASAQSLAEEIEARAEEIENSLAERGLAAYKMQVFEKSALDFHLGNVGRAFAGLRPVPREAMDRMRGVFGDGQSPGRLPILHGRPPAEPCRQRHGDRRVPGLRWERSRSSRVPVVPGQRSGWLREVSGQGDNSGEVQGL